MSIKNAAYRIRMLAFDRMAVLAVDSPNADKRRYAEVARANLEEWNQFEAGGESPGWDPAARAFQKVVAEIIEEEME